MTRRLLTTICAAGLALIGVAGCDQDASKGTALVTSASPGAPERGEMPRLLDLDGQPIPEPAADTRSTVVLFVRTDCPIANRFAPEIRRLADEFVLRGVNFRLVYPAVGDTPEKVRSHQAEYHLTLPTALDHEQRLANFLGAKATPEAFVLDLAGQVVYRGRIDDRFVDYGKARAEPSRRDLALALEQFLAGKPVTVAETQAIGCPLEATP
jgi:hypothetical protein